MAVGKKTKVVRTSWLRSWATSALIAAKIRIGNITRAPTPTMNRYRSLNHASPRSGEVESSMKLTTFVSSHCVESATHDVIVSITPPATCRNGAAATLTAFPATVFPASQSWSTMITVSHLPGAAVAGDGARITTAIAPTVAANARRLRLLTITDIREVIDRAPVELVG